MDEKKESLKTKVKRIVKKVKKASKEAPLSEEPTFGATRGYRLHTGGIVKDEYLTQ